MKYNPLTISILGSVLLSLLIIACGKLPDDPGDPDNPLDPDNPNYEDPIVIIEEGPIYEQTIGTDSVVFTWRGNKLNMIFRYKLNSEDWTDYTNNTSTKYTSLDETTHSFRIQSQYESGDISEVLEIPFTVNAIQGPALFFYPKVKRISAYQSFYIELWIDEVDAVAGISTKILFDPQKLRADEVDPLKGETQSFLLNNGGEIFDFTRIENDSGLIYIDYAMVEGIPHDVSGSGRVARIMFTHLSGESMDITCSTQSKLRNSSNIEVSINQLHKGKIIVE